MMAASELGHELKITILVGSLYFLGTTQVGSGIIVGTIH